jgi:hypothetical protein
VIKVTVTSQDTGIQWRKTGRSERYTSASPIGYVLERGHRGWFLSWHEGASIALLGVWPGVSHAKRVAELHKIQNLMVG